MHHILMLVILKTSLIISATVTIQKSYRAFQTRKQQKEDLPDLKCKDVAMAAVKIQAAYRGFQSRHSEYRL